MHIGRNYKLTHFIRWTLYESLFLLAWSVCSVVLYSILDLKWIGVPWPLVAMIGTATAFIVGFKNNATYNRLWEARQIWGGIVNSSRTFAVFIKDMSSDLPSSDIRNFIFRHLAWITALRYQLREKRQWENISKRYNQEYLKHYSVPEWDGKIKEQLANYLGQDELEKVLKNKNPAFQILGIQSSEIAKLFTAKRIDSIQFTTIEKVLSDLIDHQGRCERIKNFPYPRQFATINLFFVRIFVFLVPLGMIPEFAKLGEQFIWCSVPATFLISWVFHTMEKIGESTENPFEGNANDIPMYSLSRNIEIDLKELIGESSIPESIKPINNISL